MDLAGVGEDEAAALADSGKILAFDIRTPRARRRVLRFYWQSFERWQARAPAPHDLEAVIRHIIGAPRDGIALAHFARAIRCASEHGRNLVKARQLKLISRPRRGPNGSPKICYESARRFLVSARVV